MDEGVLSLPPATRKGIETFLNLISILKLGMLFALASLILSFQSFNSLFRNGEGFVSREGTEVDRTSDRREPVHTTKLRSRKPGF
jgi:hypothetical protein